LLLITPCYATADGHDCYFAATPPLLPAVLRASISRTPPPMLISAEHATLDAALDAMPPRALLHCLRFHSRFASAIDAS